MRTELPAPTGTRAVLSRHLGRTTVVAAVVVGLGLVTAGPAHASLSEPLDPGGTTTEAEDTPTTATTEADTPATTEADAPATTDAEAPADVDADAEEADDDGTSVAALAAVGVVAFVLGLLVAGLPLMAALAKRKKGGMPSAAAPEATPPPAPAGGPAIGVPPSRDADQLRNQRVALAEGLITLRDKLPGEALGSEVVATLAAAGITEINPLGQPFDPAQHRAVHQVAAADPSQHGTIAAVERPGYTDGRAIIRQPEVVVAVHGGSS